MLQFPGCPALRWKQTRTRPKVRAQLSHSLPKVGLHTPEQLQAFQVGMRTGWREGSTSCLKATMYAEQSGRVLRGQKSISPLDRLIEM